MKGGYTKPRLLRLAKQAVYRYPPVGASQSFISPAQNRQGRSSSIRSGVSASIITPPALLIALSIGRVAITQNGSALMAAASLVGSAIWSLSNTSYSIAAYMPSRCSRHFRWLVSERDPRGCRIFDQHLSGRPVGQQVEHESGAAVRGNLVAQQRRHSID